MRTVRVALVTGACLAAAIFSASGAIPGRPLDDSVLFRRWFTLLVESRCYARRVLPEAADGRGLVVWAAREALSPHDARWMRRMELPVLPALPSVAKPWSVNALSPSPVSSNPADLRPGDLLVYNRQGAGAQVIVYIGPSQITPSPTRWVVYVDQGRPHRVPLESLQQDPAPEWRPEAGNPYFLGIYRLEANPGT